MSITLKRHRHFPVLQSDSQKEALIERVSLSGITVSGGSEQDVLFDCKTAIQSSVGDTLTGHTDYRLQQILIEAVGQTDAEARLFWVKDLVLGFEPSTAIITESTTLVSRNTRFLPGTREKFLIDSYLGVPGDTVSCNILCPLRTVNVSILGAGDVEDGEGSSISTVNNATWRGLNLGYWLMAEYTTSVSKYTGYYQQRITAISRVLEDWSEVIVLRRPDGKFISVDETQYSTDMALDYDYGLIGTKNKGFARYGPFPMTNFTAIFGF